MTGPVGRARYRIEHRTVYTYSDEVSASYGRGWLRPREHPLQRCTAYDLRIDPEPADRSGSVDGWGNPNVYFHVTTAHRALEVVATSEVEVVRPAPDPAALDRPWEVARAADLPDAADLTLPSRGAPVSTAVAAYAAPSFPAGQAIGTCVRDLQHRIATDFAYRSGATTVHSTVEDLLATRAGVCQDFAHLGVAALRSVGLAARYVSGYLLTEPPPGQERLRGVDATHAWLAVRLPDGTWLDLDPTNDQPADERYVTLAWGRDYTDVPPLRGVVFSDAESSTLAVSVDVVPA